MFVDYQHVPIYGTIITRVLMESLQGCAYSTVAPFQETPMTILIACFTPVSAAARDQETLALKQVDMDNQLDQAPQHRTVINSTMYKNYLVHSVFDVIKTLALFLAFLTNVADWNQSKTNQASVGSDLCHFLEEVIVQLTLRAGKT